jgi:hypothetical protein
MDIFQQFFKTARAKYKEADSATGGWMPGGDVQSPDVVKAEESVNGNNDRYAQDSSKGEMWYRALSMLLVQLPSMYQSCHC